MPHPLAGEPADQPEKDPYWVDALAQGLAVLHAFDDTHPSLTLTEIATRLGWGRSKPYRFVHTLEKLGYLARDNTGRSYRLTTRAMHLGFTYLIRQPLVELAQPILDQLRQDPEVAGELLRGAFLVAVPFIENDARIVRINVSMESGMVKAIDAAASARNLTRSAFLAQAARHEIER